MRMIISLCWTFILFSCTPTVQPARESVHPLKRGLQPVPICPVAVTDPRLTVAASPRGDVCLTDPAGWRLLGINNMGLTSFDLRMDSPNARIIGGNLKGFYLLDDLNGNTIYHSWQGGRESLWSQDKAITLGAVSASGRIYLTSDALTVIEVYNNEGSTSGKITPSISNGQIKKTSAIAVSYDASYLAVYDAAEGKLYLFNGYGSQIAVTDAILSRSASSICFSRNNTLWICDTGSNLVRSYQVSNSGLTPADSFAIPAPTALAEGAYGDLYLVANGHLWMISYR